MLFVIDPLAEEFGVVSPDELPIAVRHVVLSVPSVNVPIRVYQDSEPMGSVFFPESLVLAAVASGESPKPVSFKLLVELTLVYGTIFHLELALVIQDLAKL